MAKEFLERILPWPREGLGFCNLHWTVPNQKDPTKTWMRGKPFVDADAMVSFTGWLQRSTDARDIYLCTSLQAKHGTGRTGKPVAMRTQLNAVALQSVFYDLDGKNYDGKQHALAEFLTFLKKTGLPSPTDLVDSGGGWHIYWAFLQRLSVVEWQPYANGFKTLAAREGLKIDAAVTVDAARLLRVPGTYNFKQDEPRPVIWRSLNQPYDAAEFNWVRDLAPPTALTKALHHDPTKFKAGLPAVKGPSLADGLDKAPLPIGPILAGCQFLRDAVETGGKDYAQPAWNLTTLAATFVEDGHALCHRMSNQHPGYSEENTDALWERKLKEKKEKGLGWPSCNAIQTAGSTACGACPHFAAGKSPLNLAIAKTGVAQPEATAVAAQSIDFIPPGFVVDSAGFINRLGRKKGEPEFSQLFSCRLSNPWAQKVPYEALNFTVTKDKGCVGHVTLKMTEFYGLDLIRALLAAGVKFAPDNAKYLGSFFMAWLTELHTAAESSKTEAFGWYMPNGNKVEGFIYGGLIHLPGGETKPAGYLDRVTMELYTPTGEIEQWYKCCKIVTDQHRPDLELIVVAALASPLMKFAAKESACLAAWGESGCGKTTAHKIGLAVYSHPLKTKQIALSTVKAVIERAGNTRSLPLYKDEVGKEKDDFKRMNTHLFSSTDGINADRLKSDLSHQERKTWQSLLIISGNRSFGEYLMVEQPDHDAGVKRIFEYEMHKHTTGPGILSDVFVSREIDKLDANFGMMGLKFARYLAEHIDEVDQRVLKAIEAFQDKYQTDSSERYWTTFCGVSLVAAEIGNELGCEFHLDAIKKFLEENFEEQRKRLGEERAPVNSEEWINERMAEFLADHPAAQVWTNKGQRKTYTGPPKPGRPMSVGCVAGPREMHDTCRIHWNQEFKSVRILKTCFNEWLRKNGHSVRQARVAMEKFFEAKMERATLAPGTGYSVGPNWCFRIDISRKYPVLRQALYRHSDHNSEVPDDCYTVASGGPITTGDSKDPIVPAAGS